MDVYLKLAIFFLLIVVVLCSSSAELERHEDYFVNLVLQFLSAYEVLFEKKKIIVALSMLPLE